MHNAWGTKVCDHRLEEQPLQSFSRARVEPRITHLLPFSIRNSLNLDGRSLEPDENASLIHLYLVVFENGLVKFFDEEMAVIGRLRTENRNKAFLGEMRASISSEDDSIDLPPPRKSKTEAIQSLNNTPPKAVGF